MGVVACGHPLAAGCAHEAFARGGGAVDAAIAAAAALSVVLPDACGLGGDAMALVRQSDGEVRAYNGSGAAPAGMRTPVPVDGGGTVAVPGCVAAWQDLHRDYGKLALAELLAPAVALARGGFALGSDLVAVLNTHRDRLGRWAKDWWTSTELSPGVLVRQPRLADTLERIGAEGADAFYRGELAEALAAAVRRAGGAMTSDDVRAHATIIAKPVIATFAGAQLALQPPVSQAVLAAMVLRHLDAAPTTDLDRTHAAIEFVEAAFGHRNEIASTDVDALMALTFDYDPRRALRRGGPRGYSHTAAVTTADANGCLVSMLVSIFDDFGSAVLVPEGGYLLNDRLLGFSGTTSNAPSPGARPVHTLSPIIVEQHDRVFALATPGADGQVQLLVQLLDGLIREHAPIAEVLARPRWLSLDGRVVLEAGFPRTLALSLARRGHEVVDESAGPSLFGAACVAGHDVLNGTLYAAMDPRREVWAAAV